MKSFKSALTLVAVAAALFAGAAQAADNATLDIGGTVAVNCNIAVTPTAKASTLNIITGETNAVVGVVTETCNSGHGYRVGFTSTSGGTLKSNAPGAAPVFYDLGYDGSSGSAESGISFTRDQAYFGRTENLAVSFGGNSQAIAGTYADTINITISAN